MGRIAAALLTRPAPSTHVVQPTAPWKRLDDAAARIQDARIFVRGTNRPPSFDDVSNRCSIPAETACQDCTQRFNPLRTVACILRVSE